MVEKKTRKCKEKEKGNGNGLINKLELMRGNNWLESEYRGLICKKETKMNTTNKHRKCKENFGKKMETG